MKLSAREFIEQQEPGEEFKPKELFQPSFLNNSERGDKPLLANSNPTEKKGLPRQKKIKLNGSAFSQVMTTAAEEYCSQHSACADLLASLNSPQPYQLHPPVMSSTSNSEPGDSLLLSTIKGQSVSLSRTLSSSFPTFVPSPVSTTMRPAPSNFLPTYNYSYRELLRTQPLLIPPHLPSQLITMRDEKESALGKHNLNILRQTYPDIDAHLERRQSTSPVIPEAKENKDALKLIAELEEKNIKIDKEYRNRLLAMEKWPRYNDIINALSQYAPEIIFRGFTLQAILSIADANDGPEKLKILSDKFYGLKLLGFSAVEVTTVITSKDGLEKIKMVMNYIGLIRSFTFPGKISYITNTLIKENGQEAFLKLMSPTNTYLRSRHKADRELTTSQNRSALFYSSQELPEQQNETPETSDSNRP